MDFITLYATWVTAFTACFGFVPVFMCLDWKKRGSSEGFSGVNFVFALVMVSCWLKYNVLVEDAMQICLNTTMLSLFGIYLAVFYYYQPNKTVVHWQVGVCFAALAGILRHVDGQANLAAKIDSMGSIAATVQILSMGGQLYDIYRVVFLLHTTEYLPAPMTFVGFLMGSQWMLYAVFIGDVYMLCANLPGMIIGSIMLSLYVIYPPRTWRVPIIGTGPTAPEESKKDE